MYRGFDSPLDYFLANPDKFRGLGRFQVYNLDRGLHKSLLRWGQMDEAIPDADESKVEAGRMGGSVKRKPLPRDELEKIISF